MYYFSYGSNMSSLRLGARVPAACKVGVGVLQGHRLIFHKISNKDASAKCDAYETGDPLHQIYGVVYSMPAAERPILDRFEGLGYGYEIKEVAVEMQDGSVIDAFTYYATRVDPHLKPFHWYKEHVLRGAREHALPPSYIHQQIETVVSVDDKDRQRHERELAIYQAGMVPGRHGRA
jgi:hypothetical protein